MQSEFLGSDRLAWVRSSVADVRAQPAHAAEQVTQALQGEVGVPLQAESGWLRLRLPDGYVGWVRDWHLVSATPDTVRDFRARCTARIATGWTPLRSEPQETAPPAAETLLGTRVIAAAPRADWVRVELPTGQRGWVRETQLVRRVGDWEAQASSVCRMLQGFLGVPYVWGGRSPKGFDCSGLVQFVFGLHGIELPRDSPQQFEATTAVQGAPAVGDLLFFGDPVAHVAVQFDAQQFIHARGSVRFNSLEPQHALYDAALAQQFRGATRVLPQNGATDSAT